MRVVTVLLAFVSFLQALLCELGAGDGTSCGDAYRRGIYSLYDSSISGRCISALALLQTNAQSLALPDDASSVHDDWERGGENGSYAVGAAKLLPSELHEVLGVGDAAAIERVEAETTKTQRAGAAALPPTVSPTAVSRWRSLTDLVFGAVRSVEALKTQSDSSALESMLIVVLILILGCFLLGFCAMINMHSGSMTSQQGARGSERQRNSRQRLLTKKDPTSLAGRFSPYGASRSPGVAMQSPQVAIQSPQPGNIQPRPDPSAYGNISAPGGYPPPEARTQSSASAAYGGMLEPAAPASPLMAQVSLGPVVLPPPFCPALVMPHCEAWFAVAFEKLMSGSGTFDLFGLSGKPLLRAIVDARAGVMRSIQVSMTPAKSPTLGSVSLPAGGGMEVKGVGGNKYGDIRPGTMPGSYALFIEAVGPEVMSLAVDPVTNKLIVYSQGGRSAIGWAARCMESDFFSGVEHLEVRVSPGVDSVLVLCFVLSAVVFGGAALPTTSRPASDS